MSYNRKKCLRTIQFREAFFFNLYIFKIFKKNRNILIENKFVKSSVRELPFQFYNWSA